MDIKQIEKILASVEHPAKEKDLISLNMVEDIKVKDNTIKFKLIFPSPDALSSSIKKACEKALHEAFPKEEFKVSIMELVRKRKIKKRETVELGHEAIADVGHIIAVASGKGGVGKSTVAVNLAIALAEAGYKVGLADADIYGPSVPIMTGTQDYKPLVDDSNGKQMIIPIEKYGVKWMSIGYFSKPGEPLIWRGPMASNALKQIILQVKWEELDFLLVDLPPGTGDIHISMVSDIPLSGAIVVSTPQTVALADVEKGVNMFRAKNVNKPVFGIVENMAWFTPEELPNNRYYIFGKEGCKKMATKFNLPLLGQIPLVQSIREGGDSGEPIALKKRKDGESFTKLASNIISIITE